MWLPPALPRQLPFVPQVPGGGGSRAPGPPSQSPPGSAQSHSPRLGDDVGAVWKKIPGSRMAASILNSTHHPRLIPSRITQPQKTGGCLPLGETPPNTREAQRQTPPALLTPAAASEIFHSLWTVATTATALPTLVKDIVMHDGH